MSLSKSIKEIAEGWRNTIIPPEELKTLIALTSKYRLERCNLCSHHSKFHNTPLRPDDHCTECGCTLEPKTKCLSCKCPLDLPQWRAVEVKTKEDEK